MKAERIDINKIKKRISNEKKSKDSILVKCSWNEKYVDTSELSERELLVAIVYAYNTLSNDDAIYYIMTKKRLKKYFDWSDYKIHKMVKSIPEIVVKPAWSDDGYLCGKGYVIGELT